ncbi:MAG TPA: hypothetical protein VMV92_04160 [Streptosporangiaceae bacterium]|nr:hypothetical protein [Streptosporangiaceae bacterium]
MPGPLAGHRLRSDGVRRGVTSACAAPGTGRSGEWPAGAAAWRPGTGRVIGAGFAATLASAQGGDHAAFACLIRDMQPALPGTRARA